LPNRIRELRTARGLSQKAVARKAQCSIVQVSDLERGNRRLTLAWMKRIAKALGVQPGEILFEQDNSGNLSKEEIDLVRRYRNGSQEQRWMISQIARVIVRI